MAGTSADTDSIVFEYSSDGGNNWTPITTVNDAPWMAYWDVSGLPDSDYLVRTIATNTSAATDSDPSYINVVVNNTTPESTESINGDGDPEKFQEVSSNTTNEITVGSDAGVTEVTIDEGALEENTSVTVIVPDPATKESLVPADTGSAGEYIDITLDSGQEQLANGKRANLRIPFKDTNKDRIVDGLGISIYDLRVMRYDPDTSSWIKLPGYVDEENSEVVGETDHFSLFGALAPPVNSSSSGGWSMVSVPFVPTPSDAASVFGQAPYLWNPTTETYTRVSTIEAGKAYWITGGQKLNDIIGTEAPASDFSITLKKGWNMIGTPFRFNVNLSDMTVNYNSTDYTMNQAETNGYVLGIAYPWMSAGYDQFESAGNEGTLEPWVGYWILSDKDCTLIIPPTPAQGGN